MSISYGEAICLGFEHLMATRPEVFAIGQGLWAPWYVGRSMTELEKKFGKDRVIDSPVSEVACTGAALGAGLCGYKPIVVHPRMDFMILAIDQIVSQAAKWAYMFGGDKAPNITIRGIINRGGEQGAQHSQALHSWFAHIPGLRVVMPATVRDARDLLIASVLSDEPVVYIDDRWLYAIEDDLGEPEELDLAAQKPKVLTAGKDITLVGSGFSSELCLKAATELLKNGISAEVVDLRVINPFDREVIRASVRKTGRLLAVDGGWLTCGVASEVVASVAESMSDIKFKSAPKRLTLPCAPAPTAKNLEQLYYPEVADVIGTVEAILASSVSC